MVIHFCAAETCPKEHVNGYCVSDLGQPRADARPCWDSTTRKQQSDCFAARVLRDSTDTFSFATASPKL